MEKEKLKFAVTTLILVLSAILITYYMYQIVNQ